MATSDSPPRPAISDQIWDAKYRLKSNDATPVDVTLADTWRRVATAAATAEKAGEQAHWAEQFRRVLDDLTFLPAGRIIAGAGTGRTVTLFNCFVMGTIEDDLGSIFSNLREAALTMQQGGGIGHDFSTLRPNGALVRSVGAGASGPVSFMDVWDAMCRTIMSAGQRRGAMMGTMRCDHPDIETFIAAKSDPHRLRNFNLSVLVTDAFMTAVRDDKDWDLVFEERVYRTLRARDLWSQIMHATYAWAEPGVIFIDRINAMNNLAYAEEIHATNPCGEQPLPAYGACLLGSINLARLVVRPFEADAALDETRLEALVPIAVRFLDDVIDVSHYPLEAQRQEALAKRRIGLGVTGLADALAMCGVRYGSPQAERLAGHWMARIERAAYLASAELAREKGPFPRFQSAPFLAAPNVARLPAEVHAAIARHGIRNGCLTSIAPTGTISLLAGNVSSGIEPVFDLRYLRRVRDGEHTREEWVEDYAHALFRHLHGSQAPLPPAFVTAAELTPMQHLRMQAALQAHVDSSISKTINCPENLAFDAFEDVYAQAYDLGLKGCTTFRPNPITGSVLETKSAPPTAVTASVGAASVALTPEAAPPPSPSRAEPVRAVASRSVDPRSVDPRSVDPRSADPRSADPRSADPRSADPRPADRGSGIVYMTAPLEREPVLSGYTYKLKWAGGDHALYITLNDIEQDGRCRPFEIFINTRNLEHYAWTVALTRMISAVFRRGGDVSFVVDELKAVFDPQGGQWMDGRYVPSLLAAIGEIIERHMRRTGFLQPRETEPGLVAPREHVADADHALRDRERDAGHTGPRRPTLRDALPAGARLCPRCSVGALVHESGCRVCRDCGYSSCG